MKASFFLGCHPGKIRLNFTLFLSRVAKVQIFSKQLEHYLAILSKFNDWIADKSKEGKDDVSAACNDYLKALGYVSIAHAWIKILEVSFREYDQNKSFYDDKIQTANFYFKRVLPRCRYHYDLVDVMLDRAATTPLFLKDTSGTNSFEPSPLMQKKSTCNRHIEVELSSSSDENSSSIFSQKKFFFKI